MVKQRRSRSLKRFQSFDWTRILQPFLESLDCPRALSVWLCFKYDHDALMQLPWVPDDYSDHSHLHRSYVATKLLSKFDGLKLTADKRAAAVQTFEKAELQCAGTNKRLKLYPVQCETDVSAVIHRAREKIRRLLGVVDSNLIDYIADHAGFGPGVTTTVKGSWLSALNKCSNTQEVTVGLNHMLETSLDRSDWPSFWAIHNRTVRDGNVVTFVPKNAKTDRTIAVEPGINAFFQKGVGKYFRTRLRRWGINLNDQSINQQLARIGSVDGSVATLDLSCASDTVAKALVELLLPSDWYCLLSMLRSPNFLLDGETRSYEKHSSMGNGYTFELESVIFASLAMSSCDELGVDYNSDLLHVYGDDIIVPTQVVDLLTRSLQYSGFSINTEKSYSTGLFRESCGADWYNGKQCTPFYLKRSRDVLQVINFANWLRSSASPVASKDAWKRCYWSVPKAWAVKGPRNLPGIHFHVDFWEFNDSYFISAARPHKGRLGWFYSTVEWEAQTRDPGDKPGTEAGALLTMQVRPWFSKDVTAWHCSSAPLVDTARERGRWRRVTKLLDFNNWSLTDR